MHETERGLFLSCFSAPLDALWAGAAPGLQRELEAGGIVSEDGPLDLGRIRFGDVQRSGAIPSICVLYAPRSAPDTTVMLTSSVDGWYTLVHVLATGTPGRHVMVRSVSDGEQLHHLNVWSGREEIRAVLVNQDPKWTFYEKGLPLEFEDVARYQRRLKRERLDRQLLLHYLSAMGWDVGEPRFWETERGARYVEQRFSRRYRGWS